MVRWDSQTPTGHRHSQDSSQHQETKQDQRREPVHRVNARDDQAHASEHPRRGATGHAQVLQPRTVPARVQCRVPGRPVQTQCPECVPGWSVGALCPGHTESGLPGRERCAVQSTLSVSVTRLHLGRCPVRTLGDESAPDPHHTPPVFSAHLLVLILREAEAEVGLMDTRCPGKHARGVGRGLGVGRGVGPQCRSAPP